MHISLEQVEIAVTYLAKRQLQGRPTTLRQLGKRMNFVSGAVLDAMEERGVRYALIPHDEIGSRVRWGQSKTEVMLRYVPENYAKILGVSVGEVEKSFTRIFGENPKPVAEYVEAQEYEAYVAEKVDPFSDYRISRDKYEAIKKDLITFEELMQVAREKGFSVSAIRRATGGDRMSLPLPSFFWRPFVLGKKRFYLKDLLYHLDESDKTYTDRTKRDQKRMGRYGTPDGKKFIRFSEPQPQKRAKKRKKKDE